MVLVFYILRDAFDKLGGCDEFHVVIKQGNELIDCFHRIAVGNKIAIIVKAAPCVDRNESIGTYVGFVRGSTVDLIGNIFDLARSCPKAVFAT